MKKAVIMALLSGLPTVTALQSEAKVLPAIKPQHNAIDVRIKAEFEGNLGLHLTPGDPGGYTNKGIAISRWKERAPKLGIGTGTLPELAKLDSLTWLKLVSDNWHISGADRIINQKLAVVIAELYWASPANVHLVIQAWLRANGSDCPADGIIGPRTIDALNQVDGDKAAKGMMKLHMKRLKQVHNQFSAGWNRRYNTLMNYLYQKYEY